MAVTALGVTKAVLLAGAFLGAGAASCKGADRAASAGSASSTSAAGAGASTVAERDRPPSPASRGGSHLRFADAPPGSVAAIVRRSLSEQSRDQRRLLVYVGASWCEPCQRFHDAAERGELDSVFGDVTLLAFDLDRDGDRLRAAGYQSEYIPLFALPAPDGSASGKQIQGSIKGEGAVADIAPRLARLLAP